MPISSARRAPIAVVSTSSSAPVSGRHDRDAVALAVLAHGFEHGIARRVQVGEVALDGVDEDHGFEPSTLPGVRYSSAFRRRSRPGRHPLRPARRGARLHRPVDDGQRHRRRDRPQRTVDGLHR